MKSVGNTFFILCANYNYHCEHDLNHLIYHKEQSKQAKRNFFGRQSGIPCFDNFHPRPTVSHPAHTVLCRPIASQV